jgi:hypothetical protein
MLVTLYAAGNKLGSADWRALPIEGAIIILQRTDGQGIEERSVDKIEDGPSGEKIIHLGGARPRMIFPYH